MHRKVIFGLPEWNIGGPCIFAERLIRGLSAQGWDARILITEANTDLIKDRRTLQAKPEDIRFDYLPAGFHDSWGLRWEAMIRYLEERAPCIYIMVHDWRNNVVAARLSDRVQIIGLVQADYDLEYDQALRLGSYWNAIVAVSDIIQFNLADRSNRLAPRLVTIRNAVPSLETLPVKPDAGPLRIVYTGELRYDQKRLGDFVPIAFGLSKALVDFELTFIGDGPYRTELEEKMEPLIESGNVRFIGRVANSLLLDELKEYHAFVLTSQFEGLSISMLEAMSRGCVPVVSQLSSQSLVVENGVNGFTVAIGDTDGFVERLASLSRDPGLRQRLSQEAFKRIADGGYRVQDMLAAYLDLFEKIEVMVEEQRYARNRGWMQQPPTRIGNINILPYDGTQDVAYVNNLAIWPNRHRVIASEAFRGVARRPISTRLEEHKIIFATPYGQISGVDIFSCNMVRELRSRGYDARIVGYRHGYDVLALDIADDIPVDELHLPMEITWPMRWERMADYLEASAPCIYVPNYHFEFSGIIPTLSPIVKVLSIAHSDDAQHYEHVARLGGVSDAIVGVSAAISQHIALLDPSFVPRLHTIPYGIKPVGQLAVERLSDKDGVIRIVFAGRLMAHQKRVQDLIDIAFKLEERRIPFELAIVGDGPERERIMMRGRDLILKRRLWFPGKLTNEQVAELLKESDIFLLPSAFEGLSVGLLEAMGNGAVPVVSDMRSGVPELIKHQVTGMIVPVGNIQGFADAIEYLYHNVSQRKAMSAAAHKTILEGGYRLQDMADRYLEVMRKMVLDPYDRPAGPIRPPQFLRNEMKRNVQLGYNLRHPGEAFKALVKRQLN